MTGRAQNILQRSFRTNMQSLRVSSGDMVEPKDFRLAKFRVSEIAFQGETSHSLIITIAKSPFLKRG